MGSAAFDLILRGLAIGGEPGWMAAIREAHKRPGSRTKTNLDEGEANHLPHGICAG